MSNISTTTPHQRRPHSRRHIEVDGDILMPRVEFAHDILGVSDKTASRMGLPTTYIGSLAYVLKNASLEIVAAKVRRRNQPEPPTPKPRVHIRARSARRR